MKKIDKKKLIERMKNDKMEVTKMIREGREHELKDKFKLDHVDKRKQY